MTKQVGDPVIDGQTTILLAETTTPTAITNYGQLYTKSSDRPFFQDGDGNEHELVEVDVEHAEFYITANTTAVTITDVNKSVALEGFSSSHLQDFTFGSSANGEITDTADNTVLRITDVAHGLITGDIVTINGLATAAQNATTAITKINNDTFDCDNISYASSAETGTWQMGSYLLTPTGGAGTYLATMSSSATSAGTNRTFLIQLCVNITAQADMKVERKFAASDIGSIGMVGLITLADANRVWLSVEGLTDGTDITFKHANLALHRV